jgi:HEAT repeat protein
VAPVYGFLAEVLPMRKPLVLWTVIALAVLAALALLVPGSPAFLTYLIYPEGTSYEGHGTHYWIRALRSPDDEARIKAGHALGAMGPEAGAAVPELARVMLEDSSFGARVEASLALTKMAPATATAVPALARALREAKEPVVRMNAVLALLRLKEEARPAVPALIEALQDEHNRTNVNLFPYTIQEAAAMVLGKAGRGTPEVVPALQKALKNTDSRLMRRAVAQALGDLGPEARPAESQLRALLENERPEVRTAAWVALKQIGAEPADAKPPPEPPAPEGRQPGGR